MEYEKALDRLEEDDMRHQTVKVQLFLDTNIICPFWFWKVESLEWL